MHFLCRILYKQRNFNINAEGGFLKDENFMLLSIGTDKVLQTISQMKKMNLNSSKELYSSASETLPILEHRVTMI